MHKKLGAKNSVSHGEDAAHMLSRKRRESGVPHKELRRLLSPNSSGGFYIVTLTVGWSVFDGAFVLIVPVLLSFKVLYLARVSVARLSLLPSWLTWSSYKTEKYTTIFIIPFYNANI